MNLEMREYTLDDYEYVNKIIKDNFGGVDKAKIIDNRVSELVCVSDSEIVGYIVLTLINNVVRGNSYYLVDYVCTSVNAQGKGVATYMMEYVIDKARKDNVKFIQLTCSDKRVAAQHLYRKVGFEKYDTNVFRRSVE